MNQKLKILKDAYYYLFSKVIPGIAGLLFIFIFTRILGISEYGKYSFLLSKFNLITSFSFGWLNQSVLRYGYSKKTKQVLTHRILHQLQFQFFYRYYL